MTIYGQTDGIVVGQPLNPNFGAANGAQATTAGFVQQPTTAPVVGGMQATGVQMSLLEACARGIIPRNANIATVAGQAVSAGTSMDGNDEHDEYGDYHAGQERGDNECHGGGDH